MLKGEIMENLGKWRTIKIGFWLGIGFIIPQLFVMYSGTAITVLAMPSIMEASLNSEDSDMLEGFSSKYDRTDQLKIIDYREQKTGNQLLILGTIENIGNKNASSIKIEAELLDENGTFLYECSEYINKDLMPGDKENYQISCGCGKNSAPEYATINIRVVSASAY